MVEAPICAVKLGSDAQLKPGRDRCANALISKMIFDPPPSGGRSFSLPRVQPTDAAGIQAAYAELPKCCARCPVLAEALPAVPKALGV